MSPAIHTRLLAAQPDERLVTLVRDGHERAFEAVVHRYRRPLLRYCHRLSLTESRAEDVLQQSMLNAWVALRRGAEVRELRPWLYRIVHNVAVNAMRGEQQTELGLTDEQVSVESVATTVAATGSVDDAIAIADAFAGMAELPLLQREVMVRTAVGGHSHEEVASDLGITDGAVRGLLYRARAQLRAAAAAVMPPPLVAWAAGNAVQGSSSSERIAEIATSGGAASLTGIAVKGGLVAITAGAAITGAVVAPSHRPASHLRMPAPKVALVSPSSGGGDKGDGGSASLGRGVRSDWTAGSAAEGDVLRRHGHRLAASRRSARSHLHHGRHAGAGGRVVRPIAATPLGAPSGGEAPQPRGDVAHHGSEVSQSGDRQSLPRSDAPGGGSGGDRNRWAGKDEESLGGRDGGGSGGAESPSRDGGSCEACEQGADAASESGSESGGSESESQPGDSSTPPGDSSPQPGDSSPRSGGGSGGDEAQPQEGEGPAAEPGSSGSGPGS